MPRNGLNIALWIAQILLALAFGFFGFLKATSALGELAKMMTWIPSFPPAFVRTLGTLEILGAIGMILPQAMRIKPFLTPVAAACFVLLQLLAIGLHASRGETSHTIGLNAVLLGLSLFVLWGRTRKAAVLVDVAE